MPPTPCGWLALDKPPGTRSTAIVKTVRTTLGCKRVGHAGTLDAPASGVLAVAIGEATKTVAAVMAGNKHYRFTVTFGASTTTDDAEGEFVASNTERPSDDEIRIALARFRGNIMQVPPAYSAVRIAGRRAHELARAGQDVPLAARPLHVTRLDLIDRPHPDQATFEMICGKGGYVRSIARDLGTELGCLGHVQTLRRLQTGPFAIKDCLTMDALNGITDPAELGRLLLPIEKALVDLPEYPCTETERGRIVNGMAIEAGEVLEMGATCWLSFDGKAIALGTSSDGLVHPRRILHQA